MNDIKDIFIFLSTSAAKRRSERQKGRFINYLVKVFSEKILPCSLERNRESGRSFLSRLAGSVSTTHLIVGDLKKAKKVIVAGYDTPTKALYPIRYYPLNISKNRSQETRSLLIKNLIAFGVLALCITGVVLSWSSPWPLRLAVMLGAMVLSYLSFDGLMKMGNWYNFNKNNGAVAVLYQMIDTVGICGGSVAYIFLDEVASSYMGYRQLQEILDQKCRGGTDVIILDCVSTGKEVFLAASARLEPKMENLQGCCQGKLQLHLLSLGEEALKQTPMSLFPRSMMLVGGELEGEEVMVPNTRTGKDSEADLQQLEDITATLIQYCAPSPAAADPA